MSAVLSNLDLGLRTVPAGQHGSYFINADGSLASSIKAGAISIIQRLPFVQSYYDPIVTNIAIVFTECIDHWIGLKNDQKFCLRTVAVEEFNAHIERILFIVHFIIAYRPQIEADPDTTEQICGLFSQLLPGHPKVLTQTLPEMSPEVLFNQLDPAMVWKMEESSLPPLTEALLQIPAPMIEIGDAGQERPSIADLPDFYLQVAKRIDNPEGDWWGQIKAWWNAPYLAAKLSLEAMCKQILEKKDPAKQLIYQSAELYLGLLLALFKMGQRPDLEIKRVLDELVKASEFCPGDWATVSENSYRELTGKKALPRDKALQWKAGFIDQQLMEFFKTVYTKTEDAHNVHLMNTLLYHWGERLGKQDLTVPRADIHVIKKATSLPYQWPDVYRYLQTVWKKHSVEALKNHSQLHSWQGSIGEFLTQRVGEKLPSVKDPQEFVLAQYFDERGLNDAGAIRFIRETLFSTTSLS